MKRYLAMLLSGIMIAGSGRTVIAEEQTWQDENEPITEDTQTESYDTTYDDQTELDTVDVHQYEQELTKEPLEEEEPSISWSHRLIVISGSGVRPQEHVLSVYEDLYLLGFENESELEEAQYYYSSLGAYAEKDEVISAAESEGDIKDVETEISSENNPIDRLQETLNEAGSPAGEDTYLVALIDTGTDWSCPNVISAASMLGEDAGDDNGHGSRMLGYLVEENPNVKVLSIKALDENGKGTVSSVYAAMEYAVEQGANLISLSASAYRTEETSLIKEEIERASMLGIQVVGAAGNQGMDAKYFIPGGSEPAWIITSCDEQGVRNANANFGATVDWMVVSGSTSEAAARFSGILSASFGIINDQMIDHPRVFSVTKDEEDGSLELPEDLSEEFETQCNTFFYGDAYFWGIPNGATDTGGATLIPGYQQETLSAKTDTANGYGVQFQSIADTTFTPGHGYAVFASTHKENAVTSWTGNVHENDWHGTYEAWGRRFNSSKAYTVSPKTIPGYTYRGMVVSQNKTAVPASRAVSSLNRDTSTTVKLGEEAAVYWTDIPGVNKTYWEGWEKTSGGTEYSTFRIDFYYEEDKAPHNVYATYVDLDNHSNILTSEFVAVANKREGETYSYNTAETVTKDGYTYYRHSREDGGNATTLSGTMPDDDVRYTVYYQKRFNLTINYYEVGTTTKLTTSHTSAHPEGETYSVASPKVTNYRILPDSMQSSVPGLTASVTPVSGTMPAHDVTINVYYRKTNLKITKLWDGDIEPTSVQMVILKPDDSVYQNVSLTAANNWTATINADFDNAYSIYESNVDTSNYTSTCTVSSPCRISTSETESNTEVLRQTSVTNRRINEITVTKQWTEEDGYLEDRPTEVMAYLVNLNTNNVVASHVLNNTNGWTWTWKNTDLDIQNIPYGVYEDVPDMYDCANYDIASAKRVTALSGKKSLGSVTLVNEYTPTFPVVKKVLDSDGNDINEEIVIDGTMLHYTIYVTNPTQRARKFDVEDAVPANSTYIDSSVNNGGSYNSSSNKVVWAGVEIAGGATKEFKFTVRAVGNSSEWKQIHNVADAWMQKSSGTRNDKTKQTTNEVVNFVPPHLPASNLKTVTDSEGRDIHTLYVEKGKNLYYHIPVTNGTPLKKTFTIMDAVPENTTFVSAGQGGVNASGVVTWTADLESGETKTFEFVVEVASDKCDIENTAEIAVDSASWDTNTVYNQAAKIVINKAIDNYYENFGETSFLFKITGSDGSVGYRMVEITNQASGSTEYTIPMYTEDDVQFTVSEIRNARYEYKNLEIESGAATKSGETAVTTFDEGKRIATVKYTNEIKKYNKASHADSVVNTID